MFKTNFNKLINSNRYKNSEYRIVKINNYYYGLTNNKIDYVDLKSNNYKWSMESRFFKYCLGSKSDVIKAFNYWEPIIIEYKIQNI